MLNHDKCGGCGLGGLLAKIGAAALTVTLLAGCATPVEEYKPRVPGEPVGYTDLQLAPNRYRVAFTGSTASTRDDVENYLLRRAAEVTLQSGYQSFVLSRRDTERDTSVYDNGYYRGPYSYYYPRAWYGTYGYSGAYSPYWGGSPWSATSYSAYAEITMLMSDQANNNPEAINAMSLLRQLQPAAPLPVASAAP